MADRLRCLAALGLAATVTTAACAARLDDPARFVDGGGGVGEATCKEGTDVEADILAVRCGGSVCHSPGATMAANLDLVSAGVTSRLAGVQSATVQCGGRLLVTPGDPAGSLLFLKVGDEPPCGSRMPLAQDPLDADDIACVRDWIGEMQ
jgi:hypothetical protein